MRQIYQLDGPIRMIEARHGTLLYNQHCHWVGKALETYGEYCEHEVHLFRSLVLPEQVIWEIGANTGSQAVPLAKMVPRGAYVGFEPQAELFKILTSNLCVNGLSHARAFNIALGEQSGLIDVPPVNYNQPGNFGGLSLLAKEGQKKGTPVEVRSPDELHWLPQPHFIKIDVEGMEAMVLRGARQLIARMQPVMYIENDRPDQSAALIQLLWDMGYELYWHIADYFNRNNHFGVASNIYGEVKSVNMLCLPKASPLRIQGLTKITDTLNHPMRPVLPKGTIQGSLVKSGGK